MKLIQGDCLPAMKEMPDNEFSLAIVDPQYGIGVNHNMGRRKGNLASNYKPAAWDSEPPPKEYFNELFRVSENQIIWGANHFMDLIGRRSSCWIVWDKLFSQDVSFASCELAYTSFKTVVKRFTHSSARRNGIHPTQKPVALYKWLLTNYAKPGQTILDTHLGSGSIAIACHDYGYDLTAYEIDKEYFEAATERIERHKAQGQLFQAVEVMTVENMKGAK